MFDEEAGALPGETLLLAAGDNVGASPPNSALLDDRPAIDVENAWGMDATSYGNHEFDFGVPRILEHLDRADFPFLSANIVEEGTTDPPSWLDRSAVFDVNGVRVGVIGATVRTTPELVRADATAGLEFTDEAEAIAAESERLRSRGVQVQIVVIHEGAVLGANRIANRPAATWEGPIIPIVEALQETSVDLVIAGHTHRIANTVVGRIPIAEGVNAGGSYSVAQLVVSGRRRRRGPARPLAWPRTSVCANGPTCKEIVDAANAETAVLRNQVIGTQEIDILRDPTRLSESAMGNLVADAMIDAYPGIDAALTNSGGLRADILRRAAVRRRGGQRDHVGRGLRRPAVRQPDGDRDPDRRRSSRRRWSTGSRRSATRRSPPGASRRWPGCACASTARARRAVVDSIEIVRPGGPVTPIGPADTVRLVTNDFMFGGGDGYTVLAGGTDVLTRATRCSTSSSASSAGTHRSHRPWRAASSRS